MEKFFKITILSLLMTGFCYSASASNKFEEEDTLERKQTKSSQVPNDLQNLIPTGSVISFAGTTAPKGWLLCDGQIISRNEYKNLYDVIGRTYTPTHQNPPLGESVFCVPDTRGRASIGVDNNANRVATSNNIGDSGSLLLNAHFLDLQENAHYEREYFNEVLIPACKSIIKTYGSHLNFVEWQNYDNLITGCPYARKYRKLSGPKSFLEEATLLGSTNSSYVKDVMLECNKTRPWILSNKNYLVLNYIIKD